MNTLKLNEQIAFLRKQKRITQEELANALGVTNQAVSKWESAQCCPDIQLLPIIAEYFSVSIDELMGCNVKKPIAEVTSTSEDDSMIEDAIVIAKIYKKISSSILQRKLNIGYVKSVNIINTMILYGYILKDTYSHKMYIWNDNK